jgi:hypothetical protein
MKTTFCVCIAASLFLVGCGEKSDKPAAGTTNASSGSPLTAPVDYLKAVGKAENTAIKTVDTTSLNQAVQLFNVDHGRNPKDLNELVEQKYIPQIPPAPFGEKLVYDANSGKVTTVKQ